MRGRKAVAQRLEQRRATWSVAAINLAAESIALDMGSTSNFIRFICSHVLITVTLYPVSQVANAKDRRWFRSDV